MTQLEPSNDAAAPGVIVLADVKAKRAKQAKAEAKKATPARSKKKKPEPTPSQLFAKDVEEMGECTDALYQACQGMDDAQRKEWRKRMAPVLVLLQQLRDDTAAFIEPEEETE